MDIVDFQTTFLIALIFIPLERVFALHPEQKVFRQNWLNDLVYLFINGIFITLGIVVMVGVPLTGIKLLIPNGIEAAIRAQPIFLQAIEAIVIADIGFYLAHRSFHTIPFLWRFHLIHHSIEEMDWLAAYRVHPVDQILTKSASLIPVLALGFSELALAIFVSVYMWQSILIHSNTRIRYGPLKWILVSPQFHHWHHANEPGAYNKNFAAQLPFIDALAGTFFLPEKRMPKKYGTDVDVPAFYHQQMAFPFLPVNDNPDPDPSNGKEFLEKR
jgi:sterol desaturase/sphingolipid hydroxylase (fatty acid hydroxylase superfamily)